MKFSKRVKIKLNGKLYAKLKAVKEIKNNSSMGLKESKMFIDDLCANQGVYYDLFIHSDTDLDDFRKNMLGIADFTIIDPVEQRCNKILSLGVGELDDYVDYITEYIRKSKDPSDQIKMILSKLSKDDLGEIVSIIND